MKSAAMEEFVARVQAASDILSVVASYVPLKRKGNRYWGCCPFHRENTPSFSVVPGEGFFYCFGCHAGGNVFKFLSLIENVSYFEAIKMQAEKLNIPLPQEEKSKGELAREQKIADMRKVLEMARDFFHSCLVNTPYGEPGLAYFAGRDISRATIDAFSLGFAPDSFQKLRDAFLRRGVKEALLTDCGLAAVRRSGEVYDRFRHRVMIPIADERGRVVGFGGRVIGDALPNQPKYLNSPETLVFNKRRLLFGLDRSRRAIKEAGYAILVEGYMDAISLFGAGVENVAASLGTAFTVEQCRLLLRYAPEIYFCYDSDEAGQKATVRALSVIRETGAKARVLIVPEGKDPDEFVRKNGVEAFRALTQAALPLAEYQIRYALRHHEVRTMEGKARALTAILPVLRECNAVERSGYVSRLTRTLGVEEGIIWQELRQYRGDPAEAVRPMRVPIRKLARQVDNAVRRAGRIVIRQVWNDPGTLAHLSALIPLAEFPYPLHGVILRYLAERAERGGASDDAAALADLDEVAADELSRALVEDTGGEDSLKLYDDCLRVLRRAYLMPLYEEHRLRADTLEKEGRDFRQELAESQRIRKEMDDL